MYFCSKLQVKCESENLSIKVVFIFISAKNTYYVSLSMPWDKKDHFLTSMGKKLAGNGLKTIGSWGPRAWESYQCTVVIHWIIKLIGYNTATAQSYLELNTIHLSLSPDIYCPRRSLDDFSSSMSKNCFQGDQKEERSHTSYRKRHKNKSKFTKTLAQQESSIKIGQHMVYISSACCNRTTKSRFLTH